NYIGVINWADNKDKISIVIGKDGEKGRFEFGEVKPAVFSDAEVRLTPGDAAYNLGGIPWSVTLYDSHFDLNYLGGANQNYVEFNQNGELANGAGQITASHLLNLTPAKDLMGGGDKGDVATIAPVIYRYGEIKNGEWSTPAGLTVFGDNLEARIWQNANGGNWLEKQVAAQYNGPSGLYYLVRDLSAVAPINSQAKNKAEGQGVTNAAGQASTSLFNLGQTLDYVKPFSVDNGVFTARGVLMPVLMGVKADGSLAFQPIIMAHGLKYQYDASGILAGAKIQVSNNNINLVMKVHSTNYNVRGSISAPNGRTLLVLSNGRDDKDVVLIDRYKGIERTLHQNSGEGSSARYVSYNSESKKYEVRQYVSYKDGANKTVWLDPRTGAEIGADKVATQAKAAKQSDSIVVRRTIPAPAEGGKPAITHYASWKNSEGETIWFNEAGEEVGRGFVSITNQATGFSIVLPGIDDYISDTVAPKLLDGEKLVLDKSEDADGQERDIFVPKGSWEYGRYAPATWGDNKAWRLEDGEWVRVFVDNDYFPGKAKAAGESDSKQAGLPDGYARGLIGGKWYGVVNTDDLRAEMPKQFWNGSVKEGYYYYNDGKNYGWIHEDEVKVYTDAKGKPVGTPNDPTIYNYSGHGWFNYGSNDWQIAVVNGGLLKVGHIDGREMTNILGHYSALSPDAFSLVKMADTQNFFTGVQAGVDGAFAVWTAVDVVLIVGGVVTGGTTTAGGAGSEVVKTGAKTGVSRLIGGAAEKMAVQAGERFLAKEAGKKLTTGMVVKGLSNTSGYLVANLAVANGAAYIFTGDTLSAQDNLRVAWGATLFRAGVPWGTISNAAVNTANASVQPAKYGLTASLAGTGANTVKSVLGYNAAWAAAGTGAGYIAHGVNTGNWSPLDAWRYELGGAVAGLTSRNIAAYSPVLGANAVTWVAVNEGIGNTVNLIRNGNFISDGNSHALLIGSGLIAGGAQTVSANLATKMPQIASTVSRIGTTPAGASLSGLAVSIPRNFAAGFANTGVAYLGHATSGYSQFWIGTNLAVGHTLNMALTGKPMNLGDSFRNIAGTYIFTAGANAIGSKLVPLIQYAKPIVQYGLPVAGAGIGGVYGYKENGLKGAAMWGTAGLGAGALASFAVSHAGAIASFVGRNSLRAVNPTTKLAVFTYPAAGAAAYP
ncbi:MAG: hypothetical protein WC306_03970, partial [Candidatus Paceibacterota bacterium]